MKNESKKSPPFTYGCTSLLLLLVILSTASIRAGGDYDRNKNLVEVLFQQTVSGVVTDENGLPVAGASIIVKGTSVGVISGFDGNYSISVDEGAVLVFSYLGFKTVEVPVGSDSTLNVVMEEDLARLDEVVIIGYGTQKKSDLTGAIGQVDGDELGKFTSPNPVQALQGRVAGVQIDNNGGSPGAGAFVTIRGSGTLSDAQPLYVIDGLFANDISNLNPADIESISVLKDASAAAIYGQRAANGVILVTTKKGRPGKISIDLDVSAGFDQIVNQLEFANARQYADIRNMANDNDGQQRAPANDTQFNPNIDTEIQDETLRSGAIFNTNLRIAGGGEHGSFSVSGNRLQHKGILKDDEFGRHGFRVNTTFNKGRFRLEQNLNLTRTKREPNFFFNKERDHLPTMPIYTSNPVYDGGYAGSATADGSLGFHGVEDVINSLGLAQLNERVITRNSVQGNIIGSYEIIDGLTYKLNAGVDYSATNDFNFTPTYLFANSNNGRRLFNELQERNTNFLSTLLENTLNYNRILGKHTFDILAGYTEQKTNARFLQVNAQNFPSNEIRVASAAADLQSTPSEESISALRSYLGRVNYSFDGKYSFTSTFRRDGSSLFASDRRFGNFLSFAGAWNIIEEPFMAKQKIFDGLKLRGSYGEVGSSNVDAYSIAPILNTNSLFIDGNENRTTGFAQTEGVNPFLQWETTTQTNFGADMAFMNNKLQVTMDYFKKESADILVNLPPTNFLGFSNDVPANAATIENKGFEFLATYVDQISDDFYFNVSANLTILDNEVTSLGNGVSPIRGGDFTSNGDRRITRTEPGHPIAAFHGWKVLGIYQTDQEAIDDGRVDAVAGDLRFQDTDGDGDLDEDDKVFLGSPIPDFTYGINFNATYKNWDLTLFFNGVSGNKIANASTWRFTFDTTSNYYAEVLNSWTPTNTNATIPRASLLDTAGNGRPSDYFLENGAYFRLRNLQLGYTLPEKLTKSIGLSKARLYFTGVNLFTITDYSGYYPESGRSGRGNAIRIFNQGVDDGAVPVARTLQWGAQLSF